MSLKKISRLLPLSLLIFSVSCGGNTNNESSTTSSVPPSSNQDKNEQGEYHKELLASEEDGLEIQGISATSSTNSIYSVENIVNCSGMSGEKSFAHKHTNTSSDKTMYLSEENSAQVILELPAIMQLGRVYIWNYNNVEEIDSSLKTFDIYYSSDGYEYLKFNNDPYTIEKNSGQASSLANKINNQDYLDLQGISAKYIKLDLLSSYGGNKVGLSEIRVYQFKSKVMKGNEVNASPFVMKGKYLSKDAYNLVNGSGISQINTLEAKGTNNPYFMYKTSSRELTFHLNGNYPIQKIGIWNYNDPLELNAGVKDLEVYTSLNGTSFDLVGTYTISQATGSDEESVNSVIELNNAQAQFIKFKYKSNYGGSGNGLSEVKFILGEGLVGEPKVKTTGLFSNYEGWSGADGIFSTSLDGNQSLSNPRDSFLHFSDTYFGKVDPVTKRRSGITFKNNSFAYVKGDNIEFLDEKLLHITPEFMEERSSAPAINWLGDSLVIDDKLYIYTHYIAKEGIVGFTQKGVDLVRFDIVDNQVDVNSKTTIIDENTNKLGYVSKDGSLSILFGSAIFENTVEAGALNPDGYIYNYGYRDDSNSPNFRELVVCRVKQENIEDLSKYEYYSDEGWVTDITKTKPLHSGVACEMSVVEINDPNSEDYGKFVVTYQKDTIGNEIQIAKSNSLFGEFSEVQTIYATPECLTMDNIAQYNGKMHPSLSSQNEILVSYTLNEAFGGNLNITNGDIYHPRFISLYNI